MKNVPPKHYHRNTACYELFLLVTCTYLEDLLIVLQLQSLDMNPMGKHMAEWY